MNNWLYQNLILKEKKNKKNGRSLYGSGREKREGKG
jgi:hypothetical protein